MHSTSVLTLVATALLSMPLACRYYPQDTLKDDLNPYYRSAFTGFDTSGHARTCYKKATLSKCSATEQQSAALFAQRCTEQGYKTFQCDCGDILCSTPPSFQQGPAANKEATSIGGRGFAGYDHTGKQRVCHPMPATVFCTAVMGEAEDFAQRCRDRGYQAFQCGCHDYICSKPATP